MSTSHQCLRFMAVLSTLLPFSSFSSGDRAEDAAPDLPRHAIVFVGHSDAARKDYDLWQIAADGTQMASLVTEPGHQSQFSLSPDGDRLVYVDRSDGQRDLWLRDFHRGTPQNLTDHRADDFAPAWSPDGKTLAFFSDRDAEKPELYLLDLDTGEVSRRTENAFYDSDASWSPDGGKILFSRFFPVDAAENPSEKSAGHGEIIELDLRTGSERQLTRLQGYCGGVDHSPDGRTIAFHRVADGGSEIWVMAADGSDPRPVTETFIDEYSPAFSPDGAWLVITAGTGSDHHGTFDLWLLRPDGSERRLISAAPNTQMEPAWRPGQHRMR